MGDFWRTPNIKGGTQVPLLMDAMWLDGWPLHTDSPPPLPDHFNYPIGLMFRYCVDRHQGGSNALFLDWSVRKIGCKELWSFKWHRSYDTAGVWTIRGGAAPDDWPAWMRGLKDY